MLQSDDEIYLAVVLSAVLMVFLAGVVGFAIFKYQQRMRKHLQEVAEMKIAFEGELLRTQLEIQEQTMQSVSQEIHDNVGQVLSLVKINLNALPLLTEQKATDKLAFTRELLNRAIADLRALSKTLNADNRLRAGLPAALRGEVETIQRTGVVEAQFVEKDCTTRLDPKQELLLFRISQELLNNALKHAQAKNLSVALDCSAGRFTLTITDDGVGFDQQKVGSLGGNERGSGLTNMQNRARLIGADFTMTSLPGQGTTARLSLPLNPLTLTTL